MAYVKIRKIIKIKLVKRSKNFEAATQKYLTDDYFSQLKNLQIFKEIKKITTGTHSFKTAFREIWKQHLFKTQFFFCCLLLLLLDSREVVQNAKSENF